jgi:multicomponent Na+:H+ antiporter subunit F
MNMRKRIQWVIGSAALLGVLYVILFQGLPVLFEQDLPFVPFFQRCFYVLLLAGALCMVRVLFGPTAADRIVAIDILGILVVGFCAVLCIPTGRNWYMDIGIAWALQSFIATIALSKFLEGRDLDD